MSLPCIGGLQLPWLSDLILILSPLREGGMDAGRAHVSGHLAATSRAFPFCLPAAGEIDNWDHFLEFWRKVF